MDGYWFVLFKLCFTLFDGLFLFWVLVFIVCLTIGWFVWGMVVVCVKICGFVVLFFVLGLLMLVFGVGRFCCVVYYLVLIVCVFVVLICGFTLVSLVVGWICLLDWGLLVCFKLICFVTACMFGWLVLLHDVYLLDGLVSLFVLGVCLDLWFCWVVFIALVCWLFVLFACLAVVITFVDLLVMLYSSLLTCFYYLRFVYGFVFVGFLVCLWCF